MVQLELGGLSTHLPPPCPISVVLLPAVRERIKIKGKCTLYVGEFQKQVQNMDYRFPLLEKKRRKDRGRGEGEKKRNLYI